MCLKISDTGHGMFEEVKTRIFEPFYTTKGRDKGTGMGLSVVHGIVKSHGGAITVRSRPGEGSLFEVYLPRIRDRVTPVIDDTAHLPTGNERILFVDDEKAQKMGIKKSILKPMVMNKLARTVREVLDQSQPH